MRKLGVGLIVAGAGAFLFYTLGETWLVVNFGIQVADFLFWVPVIFGGAGLVSLAAGIGLNIQKTLTARAKERQQQAKERKSREPVLPYSSDAYDPAYIKSKLRELMGQWTELEDVLQGCVEQINAMKRRRDNLEELLQVNDADFLNSTTETIVEVERFICRNMRSIINRGIVSEQDDDEVFVRDEKYLTYRELIQKVLDKNQVELDNVKRFLADLAEYISEKGERDETGIKHWIETIHESLKNSEEEM